MSGAPTVATRAMASIAAILAVATTSGGPATASDHLDTPSAIADPRMDIADVYAWMSPDARRLNLVMTIVGKGLSDRVSYIFHVDSGRMLGKSSESIRISCRVEGAGFACNGAGEAASGMIDNEAGATSRSGSLRAYVGLRDDPFFNNVRGTRDAYSVARAAIAAGAPVDEAGCPHFDAVAKRDILARWRATDGGRPANFLNGWAITSIVVSIDKELVGRGGSLLAISGSTANDHGQVDRAARPLTGNALLATLEGGDEGNRLKEVYNRSTPSMNEALVPEIAKGVALYDGLDGRCGDSFLVDRKDPSPERYYPLALLLADDRLWVDSRFGRCTAFLAVERAALDRHVELADDCGGRTPRYDASNIFRSMLAGGKPSGIDDGLTNDEVPVSDTEFPFLAPTSVR